MSDNRIDFDAINELKEMLEDEFPELIETYTRDVTAKLKLLGDAIDQADSDAVRKIAHSMKGASVNIGILKYGEICNTLESAAIAEQNQDYQSSFERLQQEFIFVEEALNTLIA
jgi:HPt (histidine-containing phosphotransfer) domain-containing protein